MKRVKSNVSNRVLYTFLSILISVLILGGIYALSPGESPNPGHPISEIGPPGTCASGQFLKFENGAWTCGTVSSSQEYTYSLLGASCLSSDTPIAYMNKPGTCSIGSDPGCTSYDRCTTQPSNNDNFWSSTRKPLQSCTYQLGVLDTGEYFYGSCSYHSYTCYAIEYVLCSADFGCKSCPVGTICKDRACYKPAYKAVFADGSTTYFDSLSVTFDLKSIGSGTATINGVSVAMTPALKSVSRTLKKGSNTVNLNSDNGHCDSCGLVCEGVYTKVVFSGASSASEKIITTKNNRVAGCAVYTEMGGYVDTLCCGNCCYTNYQTAFTVSDN